MEWDRLFWLFPLQPTPTPLRPAVTVTSSQIDDDAELNGGQSDVKEVSKEAGHDQSVAGIIRSTDSHQHDYTPATGAARSLMDK